MVFRRTNGRLGAGVVLGLAAAMAGCGGGGSSDQGTPDQSVSDEGMTDACMSQEDLPDVDSVDTNCDGIDGDADDAVFVTADGSLVESATVGTRAMPAGSIEFGLELAVIRGKSQVLVASGEYSEDVVLVEGIAVSGGYDVADDWQTKSSTNITGSVTATDIETRTVLGHVSVTSPDATTPGGSSIALRIIRSSGLEVVHARFVAGAGMAGASATGVLPAAASGTSGDNFNPTFRVAGLQTTSGGTVLSNPEVSGGTKANHALPNATDCASGTSACGQVSFTQTPTFSGGGTNTCGCGRGGVGGAGVVIPATLPAFTDFAGNVMVGRGGAGGTGEVPGDTCGARVAGTGGAAGHWSIFHISVTAVTSHQIGARPTTQVPGVDGAPGAEGANGPDGDGGLGGTFDETGYVPGTGSMGETGVGGAGGAGGGAGAAFLCADEGLHNGVQNEYEEVWVIMTGGAGGGGGAGGCAGTGGAPGSGGGASIAIFVWDSTPTFVNVAGDAGSGGQGGAGQAGQAGGTGADGTLGRSPFNTDLGFGDAPPSVNAWEVADSQRWCVPGTNGGDGGRGGDGGDGGGGGGGAGGPSIGIALLGGSTLSAASDDVVGAGNMAGAGGNGGGADNAGAAGQSIDVLEASN